MIIGRSFLDTSVSNVSCGLNRLERLVEIVDDVFDVLYPDGEAHQVLADARFRERLRGKLTVRGARRVNGEALRVTDVCELREQPERIDELSRVLFCLARAESDDASVAVFELLCRERARTHARPVVMRG